MLTPLQVESFHQDGFLHMPQLVPGPELLTLQNVSDRLEAAAISRLRQPGYFDRIKRESKAWIEHPEEHFVYREKPDGSLSFHRIERMFTQDDVFVQMAVNPRLLQNVWAVLQRPFWPRGGSLVVKLPYEGAEVRWHQDIPYLFWSTGGHTSKGRKTTHPIPNFTTDIYLDAATKDNGCLWAIPGTHKNGTIDVDKMVAEHGWYLPGSIALEAQPGDVMFHHVAVLHGSPENHAPTRRRTFYIHYLNDETVQDAYSDWPDLMAPEEALAFWGGALAKRHARRGTEGCTKFMATRAGFVPA